MLLFRSEEHVERSGKPAGAFMSTDQIWGLADTWYHDRDDPKWRRRNLEESQKVFEDLGLTGDFWNLG
jgi:hypothetical protein